MAGSTYGTIFKISTWGESHGKALGVVIDGCPAGLPLSEEDIQIYLDRRKPGQTSISTPRKESDQVEILSGVFEGKTTGTPISLMIRNTSQKSSDYSQIASCYRPGHADYPFDAKYGFRDYRGGGRSSGKPRGVWRQAPLRCNFYPGSASLSAPTRKPSAPSPSIMTDLMKRLSSPRLPACRIRKLPPGRKAI